MMPIIHVALWEPEIPPNTGNIARLCAATGAPLHLIGRLGFRTDERALRRAGVDCWPALEVHRHDTLAAFARAAIPYTSIAFAPGDCLLFGPESRGLPEEVLHRHADRALCIPMPAGAVRSLNLATAVGIVLYEALRQQHRW
jgi:tRNA (cytidine/uridine-2'-O-)-methyltransferase